MIELIFTPDAKEQYDDLTGSQKYFVDQGLDKLKRNDSNYIQHIANIELGMTIIFEQLNNKILITDIVHDSYRNTKNYQKAQKRMNDWNN